MDRQGNANSAGSTGSRRSSPAAWINLLHTRGRSKHSCAPKHVHKLHNVCRKDMYALVCCKNTHMGGFFPWLTTHQYMLIQQSTPLSAR